MKEPGQLAFETREKHYEWEEQTPWRLLHPQDKAEWAAVEAAVLEEAAKVAESTTYAIEIDKWVSMTKKEHGQYACLQVAAAIRAMKAPE